MLNAAFRHAAFVYEGDAQFLDGVVPFVRAGVEAGEPVLAAVGAGKIARLSAALGPETARHVCFADMAELGANPARIIPAWSEFVASRRPARGVGEPVWAGRSARELVECQLHEALLNVAFLGTDGFQLLCPYDAATLSDAVIHEARCTHPEVREEGAAPAVSHDFRGAARLLAPFEAPLPRPEGPTRTLSFDADTLTGVRWLAYECGERAGLGGERLDDLVLAVAELTTNSVRHGGGRGVLRVWIEPDGLLCEVVDRGRIRDPLAGRRRPNGDEDRGRGLWIANQLADLVQIRSGTGGTAVRLLMRV